MQVSIFIIQHKVWDKYLSHKINDISLNLLLLLPENLLHGAGEYIAHDCSNCFLRILLND